MVTVNFDGGHDSQQWYVRVIEDPPARILFDDSHDELFTITYERALTIDPDHPDWFFLGELKERVERDFIIQTTYNTETTLDDLNISGGHAMTLAFSDTNTWKDLNWNGEKDENEPTGPFSVIAVSEYGNGKLVIITDIPFTQWQFSQYSHTELILNSLNWLSEGRLP